MACTTTFKYLGVYTSKYSYYCGIFWPKSSTTGRHKEHSEILMPIKANQMFSLLSISCRPSSFSNSALVPPCHRSFNHLLYPTSPFFSSPKRRRILFCPWINLTNFVDACDSSNSTARGNGRRSLREKISSFFLRRSRENEPSRHFLRP